MRILLIIMSLIFTLNAKSLFSNSGQEENSKYIGALKDLVIATQKTRGLTNNYLNGNTTSMLLVYGTRKNMKKAIGIMESLPLAADPIINSRATSISQSLISLNRVAFNREPAGVFSKYTELIEQTLMLAQSVSKRGSEDLNLLGKELSTIMMEVILPFTEYVGQMRGMGSGIVAKRKITPKQNAQMLAIIHEIENLNSKLLADMQVVISKNKSHFEADISIKLAQIEQDSKAYIYLTKTNVLRKKEINLNTNKYFNQGTDLISLLIEVYNINNKVILEDSKGWI
ncbi:nitrate- and nitrite sensing domain-containing protein [Sulfurimonas sp.]|uniref:nitrate- and nitrite sensing domain-containing protein n=1 Tax=Sulfurimonas sp. TaxID=2022749 RepID=UPI002AB18C5C|nr:nitrate- and nitrite sensing domain-containing protein [Sulfurimonas sp.]